MTSTYPELFHAAARLFRLPVWEITAHTREPRAVEARWCVAWVLRRRGLVLTSIGAHLQRDHTTIVSSLRRIEERPDLLHLAARLAEVREKCAA